MVNTYCIIVTYNGLKWIEKCIQSIANNGCTNIISVDNASTDGTPEFIIIKFPFVDVIQSKKNLGFGAANNVGIQKAMSQNCDCVFLVNQDVYLKPNVLQRLHDQLMANRQIGILSPMHLNGNASDFDSNFLQNLLKETENGFITDLYLKRVPATYKVSFVNAAAWLVKAECIKKVGLFDPIFFHYGEDNNYCQRVKYHNYQVHISTESEIMHDRADRKGGIRAEFVKQHVMNNILIELCNPNNEDTPGTIITAQKKLLKTMFSSLMKLNLRNVNFATIKYKFIANHKSKIIASTQKNRSR